MPNIRSCLSIAMAVLLAPVGEASANADDLVQSVSIERDKNIHLSGILEQKSKLSSSILLIIGGAGDLDRDGNLAPSHVGPDTYKLLARSILDSSSIQVARFDKRPMLYGPNKPLCGNRPCSIDDSLEDVKAEIDEARRLSNHKCVWLLGHSEGGLLALMVASNRSDICGVILIAAPGRPMLDVIQEQIMHVSDINLRQSLLEIIDALRLGQLKQPTGQLQEGIMPLTRQYYLLSEADLKPTILIGSTLPKILILQGDDDLQVSIRDAQLLAQASINAEIRIIPGVNHQLRFTRGLGNGANILSSLSSSSPIDQRIARLAVRFIESEKQP